MDQLEFKPLTDEEFSALVEKFTNENDYSSELARVVFTLVQAAMEIEELYVILSALHDAGAMACLSVAQDAIRIIGLKDTKKVNKIYAAADKASGNIEELTFEILDERLGAVSE